MKNFILILSILLIYTNCSDSASSSSITESIGEVAPDFTFTTLTGGTVTLSDYKGKIVYLFFYGANCPHCRTNGPVTESSIYQVFKDNPNFVAFGLDTWNASVSDNNSFKITTGISYPLLLNARQSLIDFYGNASAYDRSVVIDVNGAIAYQGSGFVNSDVQTVVATIQAELENITP